MNGGPSSVALRTPPTCDISARQGHFPGPYPCSFGFFLTRDRSLRKGRRWRPRANSFLFEALNYRKPRGSGWASMPRHPDSVPRKVTPPGQCRYFPSRNSQLINYITNIMEAPGSIDQSIKLQLAIALHGEEGVSTLGVSACHSHCAWAHPCMIRGGGWLNCHIAIISHAFFCLQKEGWLIIAM
jgi:hypothetical protein